LPAGPRGDFGTATFERLPLAFLIRPGPVIGATLTRDPPEDVLVLRKGISMDDFRRARQG
jgi:hypothetical protein